MAKISDFSGGLHTRLEGNIAPSNSGRVVQNANIFKGNIESYKLPLSYEDTSTIPVDHNYFLYNNSFVHFSTSFSYREVLKQGSSLYRLAQLADFEYSIITESNETIALPPSTLYSILNIEEVVPYINENTGIGDRSNNFTTTEVSFFVKFSFTNNEDFTQKITVNLVNKDAFARFSIAILNNSALSYLTNVRDIVGNFNINIYTVGYQTSNTTGLEQNLVFSVPIEDLLISSVEFVLLSSIAQDKIPAYNISIPSIANYAYISKIDDKFTFPYYIDIQYNTITDLNKNNTTLLYFKDIRGIKTNIVSAENRGSILVQNFSSKGYTELNRPDMFINTKIPINIPRPIVVSGKGGSPTSGEAIASAHFTPSFVFNTTYSSEGRFNINSIQPPYEELDIVVLDNSGQQIDSELIKLTSIDRQTDSRLPDWAIAKGFTVGQNKLNRLSSSPASGHAGELNIVLRSNFFGLEYKLLGKVKYVNNIVLDTARIESIGYDIPTTFDTFNTNNANIIRLWLSYYNEHADLESEVIEVCFIPRVIYELNKFVFVLDENSAVFKQLKVEDAITHIRFYFSTTNDGADSDFAFAGEYSIWPYKFYDLQDLPNMNRYNMDIERVDYNRLPKTITTPIPENASNPIDYNGIFFAFEKNVLYYSLQGDIANFVPTNQISFDTTIIAIKTTKLGLIVFLYNKTFVLTGTNNLNYTLTELSNTLGCIDDSTIQLVNDKLIWLSTKGLLILQNSSVLPLSSNFLDLSYFKNASNISSISIDYRYFIKFNDKILIVDFRDKLNFTELVIDLPGADIGDLVHNNENVFVTASSNNKKYLVSLMTGDSLKLGLQEAEGVLKYKSQFLADNAMVSQKQYNKLSISYNGEFTVNFYVDGTKISTYQITSNSIKYEELKIPHTAQRGYFNEVEFIGSGSIYEYATLFSKR